MNPLVGKWQQPEGQAYAGLIFDFKEDGTFKSEYIDMGITSSGTYTVENDVIHMDQTSHTFGLLGKFDGRFLIEGDSIKLIFGNPGEPAPEDLSKARLYHKI
jgi:hypothetical protein